MTDLQIIRPIELAKLLGVSKQTIWRLSTNGTLPPKVQIGSRSVGWKRSDIETFLEERTENEPA